MRKRQKRMMVLTTISVFMAGALFLPGLVGAGEIEPPAEAVDGSGNPVSTMKTLDQIPPTWSQKLQCDGTACPRFELVLDGWAVLDKETGLVWEKSLGPATVDWGTAINNCYNKGVGGRKGFRLPTIEELASLVVPQANPALPSGHPFENVNLLKYYWSSTTDWVQPPLFAFSVRFSDGDVCGSNKVFNNICCVWCVRGGHGHDTY